MEIYINQKIFEICKKEIRLFKSKCLDENYDLFKNNNQDDFNILFLQAMCVKGKNMKILKNKLLNHNIEEKYINNHYVGTRNILAAKFINHNQILNIYGGYVDDCGTHHTSHLQVKVVNKI